MKTIAQQLNVKDFPFEIRDKNGNRIYFEKSNNYWAKWEFDSNGNQIYLQNSYNYWTKRKYDSNGNQIYYENSTGYWRKSEYDSDGNEIYYENSDGVIEDNRHEIEDGFIVTHYGGLKDIVILNGVKYKRIEQ